MYRGIRARVNMGRRGFSGNQFPNPDFLTKADNIIFENDYFRKLPGTEKIDANAVAGTPAGYGAIAWKPEAGIQNIITAWSNGKVYYEDGLDIDDTESHDFGSSLIGPVIFAEGGQEAAAQNKKLFAFSEEKAPFYIDGTTKTSQSLTASLDWSGSNQPSAGTEHDGRVVAWGNANFPHNLYFTKVDDHTTFTGSGTFTATVAPGVGRGIRACVSWFNQRLYVFKDSGIWYVDTTDIASATFLPTVRFSSEIGIAGPRAWAFVAGDLWFLDQNGLLRSLAGVDRANDLRESNLFAQLKMNDWARQNIDRTRLKFATLNYDSAEQILYIDYTSKTSSNNNARVIINLQEPNNPRVSFDKDRGNLFESSFFYGEKDGVDHLYAAGADGFVRKLDKATRSIDGSTGYTARIRTPQEDFRFMEPIIQQPIADRNKRFDRVLLTVVGTNESTVSVQPYIDGVAYGSAFTINIDGNTENSIQSPTSDFDLTDSLLISDAEDISRIDHIEEIGGCGRYISFEITQTGNNEDVKIIEAYVYFNILGVNGLG